MDPANAAELWRLFETGRWSVVDGVDRDGVRYLLACESDSEDRALTLRERQVVKQASLGDSNKVIAYDLGVATSTISTHLARAAAKLGLRSRAAMIQLVALGSKPRADVAVMRLEWRGKRFAIVALPLVRTLPGSLTGAERDVAQRVLAGQSNAQIARARRVSPRTVENQVASIMRKLGASSRASLTARLLSR